MTVLVLDGTDLVASIADAQAELAAAPAGSARTWVVPSGTHELTSGVSAGVAGRSLTIRGPGATLALGTAAPLPGDVTGLDVVGVDVAVHALAVSVRAEGEARAVRLRAERAARLQDVGVDLVAGSGARGAEVEAPRGGAVGLRVGVVRSDAAAAGLVVSGGRWALSRLRIGTVSASGAARATGVRARAESLGATDLRIGGVEGPEAVGLGLRCRDELSLLDVAVGPVTATSDAVGTRLICTGDVAVRGMTVEGVTGARAAAAVLVVGRELDWSGGRVSGVRGSTGGSVGVRVLATPERAALRLADLLVEDVSAARPGLAAEPADSWRAWLAAAATPLAQGADLPELPSPGTAGHVEDAVAIHVCAPVDEGLPWLRSGDPGAVEVAQCVVERISGTALQVVADLRDVEVRGLLLWTAVRAGHVEAERVLLAQSTVHRVGFGLGFGPCALTVADTLVTAVGTGPGVALDEETELATVVTSPIAAGLPPFEPAPDPLPYTDPGPLDVPAAMLAGDPVGPDPHDLRVAAELHARAGRVPGDDDDAPAWLGALAPDTDARCELRDPDPPAPPPPPPAAEPGPVVDYRARDARSLVALMSDRARQVMPGWEPTGAADLTTMLLEVFAERLDHLAYRQEVAVSEGTLPTALERRSVEDHVRLVDHSPDRGLSATAMLRFRLDPGLAPALGLGDRLAADGQVVVGRDTLVVNPDATDRVVVFGTESDLALSPELDTLELADEADLEPGVVTCIEAGDTEALLAGDLTTLLPGRWLVVVGVDAADPERLDPDVPAHVVRVTAVELGTDTTRVQWDPRRPAPVRYDRATTRVLGNVVPAHHGIPLTPVTAVDVSAVLEQGDLLAPWRERLSVTVDGAAAHELTLPVDRVSVHAAGWPFPAEPARSGQPQIALAVDREPWARVEELSQVRAGEEAFALRTGPGDRPVARFPEHALPARTVTVDLGVRVGLGVVGNVGVGALTRLLALGPSRDRAALLGDGGADRLELLRRTLRVSNPVTGVGGREPEDLESLRYRAPLGVRDALSAVVPADYERLVGELPEVAAARAVVADGPLAPVVSVTVLLRDEDRLAGGGDHEAERLRRWAAARARLEDVRLLGFDVALVPPRFVPLDLDVVVDVDRWALDRAEVDVRRALTGPDGLFAANVSGLRGDVRVDALVQRLLTVSGVRSARVRRLRRLQRGAQERARTGVLVVEPDEVAILDHPYGRGFESGLLTVGVCEAQP